MDRSAPCEQKRIAPRGVWVRCTGSGGGAAEGPRAAGPFAIPGVRASISVRQSAESEASGRVHRQDCLCYPASRQIGRAANLGVTSGRGADHCVAMKTIETVTSSNRTSGAGGAHWFERLAEHDHEQVIVMQNRETGLRGFLAIH